LQSHPLAYFDVVIGVQWSDQCVKLIGQTTTGGSGKANENGAVALAKALYPNGIQEATASTGGHTSNVREASIERQERRQRQKQAREQAVEDCIDILEGSLPDEHRFVAAAKSNKLNIAAVLLLLQKHDSWNKKERELYDISDNEILILKHVLQD
jgi:hypothetical protein